MPQPTTQHQHLQKMVGHWEGTLTAAMPGAPEQSVPAKEVVTAFGPFFTQSVFECNLGMPYKGTGCVGYDPLKKHYVGTWIDNMNPHLAVMEGTMDAENNTITMRWESPDPQSGKMVPHWNVMKLEGDDGYESTFYMGADKGTKVMTIKMKRKKEAKADK